MEELVEAIHRGDWEERVSALKKARGMGKGVSPKHLDVFIDHGLFDRDIDVRDEAVETIAAHKEKLTPDQISKITTELLLAPRGIQESSLELLERVADRLSEEDLRYLIKNCLFFNRATFSKEDIADTLLASKKMDGEMVDFLVLQALRKASIFETPRVARLLKKLKGKVSEEAIEELLLCAVGLRRRPVEKEPTPESVEEARNAFVAVDMLAALKDVLGPHHLQVLVDAMKSRDPLNIHCATSVLGEIGHELSESRVGDEHMRAFAGGFRWLDPSHRRLVDKLLQTLSKEQIQALSGETIAAVLCGRLHNVDDYQKGVKKLLSNLSEEQLASLDYDTLGEIVEMFRKAPWSPSAYYPDQTLVKVSEPEEYAGSEKPRYESHTANSVVYSVPLGKVWSRVAKEYGEHVADELEIPESLKVECRVPKGFDPGPVVEKHGNRPQKIAGKVPNMDKGTHQDVLDRVEKQALRKARWMAMFVKRHAERFRDR